MIILFRSIFIGEKDIESNQNSKMNLNYFCYRLRRPKLKYTRSPKKQENWKTNWRIFTQIRGIKTKIPNK